MGAGSVSGKSSIQSQPGDGDATSLPRVSTPGELRGEMLWTCSGTAARNGFHFDTAQMPLNLMGAHFRSFARLVVPRLVEQHIGVLGMKPMGGADGVIGKTQTATPFDCLHYALNLPTSVVITGVDKQAVLDRAFEAAKTFRRLDDHQFAELVAKTQAVASRGQYDLYKTSAHFDSTAKHADWLGGETPAVQQLAPPNT